MKEAGASNIGNWRPNLLPSMDDVNTKSVDRVPPNVIPVDARYQHLPLVIVHKQSANHFLYFSYAMQWRTPLQRFDYSATAN